MALKPDFTERPNLKRLERKDMRLKRPGLATSQSSPRKARLDEILRVDHAGEYGAVRIYQGQIAVLNARKVAHEPDSASLKTIRHMQEQEHEHLETFNKLLNERGVRPTVMTPIWHAAGYALGATTALMGEKAAMACTEAVEEVIEKHYQDQLDTLSDDEADLADVIRKFRDDEIAHKETAIEHGSEEAAAYPFLTRAIKAGTRAAIRISEKV